MDVGFIGLGNMGSRMAANVVKAGHRMWAYDIAPNALARAAEIGAVPCRSVREACQGRDAVILSLPGPPDVEKVVLGQDGVLSASPVPPLLLDTTTSLPVMTKRVAAAAAGKGCQMLDAPVSGGIEGAAAGTLSIMVGGPPEVYERALPLLKGFGRDITRIGDLGAGNTMKLANNILGAVTMVAISEALMMGTLSGIDPQTLFDVISVSTGNSRCLQSRVPRLLSGNFEPGFAIELMHKDLDLAAQLGQEVGVPMPLVNLAKQTYQAAKAAGLGKKDTSAVAVLLERLMGREIRAQQ